MALARPLGGDPVRARRRSPSSASSLAFVGNDFSVLYVATNSNRSLPTALPLRRGLGRPRGLDAAVDADARRLDASPSPASARHLPDKVVARILAVMGWLSFGFLLFMLMTSNPFDRLVPDARRRPRPEPAAAGPGHGDPPADALHGLRRLLGGVLVRRRGADRRQPRRHLGALDAPLDHGRLDLPHPRHRARQLAGPTTSSAGAAGGSGIRSRTPRSCPGWSAPR